MSALHVNSVGYLLTSVEKQNAYVEAGCTAAIDIATDLAEAAGSYESHIKDLEGYTQTYAEVDYEVDTLKIALKKIQAVVAKQPASASDVPNLPELFEQFRQEAVEKQKRKDVRNHPRCVEFRKKVYGDDNVVDKAGGAAAAAGDAEDGDEDLAISQVEVSMNCPITQQPFVDPVRNEACKHSYSKEAILGHLRKKNGRVRCPFIGCVQVVTNATLAPDHALQGKLRRRQKRALPAR